MTGRERETRQGVSTFVVLALLLALPACSMLFPHTELAIQPEGATLDELGIALLADFERWIDSILFMLGLAGLV